MPQDKIAPIKEKAPFNKGKELPFIDSLTPGRAEPPQASGLARNFVRPKDRVAKVTADAPKEEQSSSIFSPDKSPNYSIRDKAPQDR